jgi:hypothetical protein
LPSADGRPGLPFANHRVLASGHLSTSNWIQIRSVSSSHEFSTPEFVDADTPNHPMRFYQFVIP